MSREDGRRRLPTAGAVQPSHAMPPIAQPAQLIQINAGWNQCVSKLNEDSGWGIAMTTDEYERKLDEVDRLLNDPKDST